MKLLGDIRTGRFLRIMLYTEKQWIEEMLWQRHCGQSHEIYGSCNLECPSCHEIGFYGPRMLPHPLNPGDKITRMYRACKWCGLLQEAWGSVLDDDPRKGNPYKSCFRRHKKCRRGVELNLATFYPEGVPCDDCGENVEQFVRKDDPSFLSEKTAMDNMHRNIPRITIRR